MIFTRKYFYVIFMGVISEKEVDSAKTKLPKCTSL